MTEAQFEYAYNNYRSRIAGFIARKKPNYEVVQDLVQDVFLKFYKSEFNSFEDENHLFRYLLVIAKTTYAKYVRYSTAGCRFSGTSDIEYSERELSKNNYKIDMVDSFELSDLEEMPALSYNDYTQQQENERLQETITVIEEAKKIVEAFKGKQKQAMIECCWNLLSSKEVAKKIDSTCSSINFMVSTGRKRIIKELQKSNSIIQKNYIKKNKQKTRRIPKKL